MIESFGTGTTSPKFLSWEMKQKIARNQDRIRRVELRSESLRPVETLGYGKRDIVVLEASEFIRGESSQFTNAEHRVLRFQTPNTGIVINAGDFLAAFYNRGRLFNGKISKVGCVEGDISQAQCFDFPLILL